MSQSDKASSTGGFPWKELLVLLGVLITAYFGYLGIRSQIEIPIHATQTAEANLTALANIPSATPPPTLSLEDLKLTAIAIDAKLTQVAGATATQEYINVVQTVQANATATSLYAQVAAEQAQNVEATAQAIISIQQTATAVASNQKIEQLLGFVEQVPNLPISFYDSFEDNKNDWSPKNYNDYSISLKGDVLTTNLKNPSTSPLIWTCEKCNSFNNFSYQIDIKTPVGIPRVVSGIVFGSPSRLDQQPLQDYYMLSIYSSGDIILERVSATSRDIIKVWEHRQDLLTPDGQFHTLQVITIDNLAVVYLDGKSVGDVFPLEYSTQGYIGIVIESSDVDVVFDNLKVVLMP
jgi:hypothetical protein